MEPRYVCRTACEKTNTSLYRIGSIYEVMEIEGEYYVFNDRYEHSKVYKSDYNDNAWLTNDGSSARFLACQ